MKNTNKKTGWKSFGHPPRKENVPFDLWMAWGASPLTMGISDSFRVTDAFLREGKWFHRKNGEVKELCADYITHWMPIPKPPKF